MTLKQLNNLLNIVNKIEIHNYEFIHELYYFVCEHINKIEIIKFEFHNHSRWKNDYDKDYLKHLSNKNNFITYSKCLKAIIKNCEKNKKFIEIEIIVYDGDMVNGLPISIRLKTILNIPYDFLKKCENLIIKKLKIMGEDAYHLHLENEKNNFINNFIKEIIELNK